MPPSATLFNARGDTLDIGTDCRDIPPFVATDVLTTQSYLLLFRTDGCPSDADVKCCIAWTRGVKRSLGTHWSGQVISAYRHDLPNGYL
jgi:hypothetical protein